MVRFSAICAGGLNAHGIDVAMPSYDLCPAVTVGEIIRQMRTASRELAKLGRPLVISGHSAGGHLAACLLATDWPALDASLPEIWFERPMRFPACSTCCRWSATSINNALRLDEARRSAASPLSWKAPAHGSLDAVVGGKESAEYFRQSQTMVEALGESRPGDAIRRGPRRQPFYRDRAAGRSGLGHGRAAEATGAALKFSSMHKKTREATGFQPCGKLL